MDLYASKGRFVAGLQPVVRALAARGVAPDLVTAAAVPVAAVAAVVLLASPSLPAILVAIPFLAAIRLILNLIDGSLARQTGRSHARGELLNEVSDRAADILFLAPVAWLPGASREVVLVGVLGAVLASYVGVVSKAAGGARIYRGVLSKPGRMVLISVASIVAIWNPAVAWSWFGVLLLVGVALTLLERLVVAWRALA
jgi:CDP-diacylglycerol--glycerol-3-phosphate 3-phosphatidyltransferase